MKTKIILVLLAAITLLSFTLISSSHSSQAQTSAQQQVKGSQSGFELQDSNQF